MKFVYLLGVASVIGLASCNNDGGVKDVSLNNAVDSFSYSVGVVQGKQFSSNMKKPLPNGESINIGTFLNGFIATFNGKETAISKENSNKIMNAYSIKLREAAAANQLSNDSTEVAEVATTESKSGSLKTALDSFSYSFGVIQANQILDAMKAPLPNGDSINSDAYLSAFVNNVKGEKTYLTEEKADAYAKEFSKVLQEAAMAKEAAESKIKNDSIAAINEPIGAAFLAENGKKKGVVTTASGLQYEVITKGSGKKPLVDDTVEVDYVGTLIDGTEFDSSIKRNQHSVFPLKNVIEGWVEGLQLMNKGGKYRFFIPSELAYGKSGSMGIEPGSTLIFDVTLYDINPKK